MSTALRRDAAANRERLIAAAIDVFNDEGMDAGVERIAHRAGVGVGTLYRRFPTKEALVAHLVDELITQMVDSACSARDVPDGNGLEHFVRGIADTLSAHRGCLSRLWTHEYDKHRAVLRRRLGQLVQDAHAAGAIRADVTVADVRSMLWSLHGVIANAGDDAARACGRHLDLLFAGMR